MKIPQEYRKEIESFPVSLRALLDAELDAGNEIAELGHGFPAAPVGAYIKLKKRVSTREKNADDGLKFYERNGPSYSGEFTDQQGYFFILNPPVPEPPQPSMDEIREAHSHGIRTDPLLPKTEPISGS